MYIKPYRYFKVRVIKSANNILKRIDLTLPLNQGVSVKYLNAIDTTLPNLYKAVGYSGNSIYYYKCTLPQYTPNNWEECSWFTENLHLTATDTIVKTFIID